MKPRGQIATFLLLLVSVVLIFALVVMNLGRVATTSTQVANATDSTMLLLASQMASRSNQLCFAIDSEKGNNPKCVTEKCNKTGLLSTLLAIVAATIVTIATAGAGAPLGWALIAKAAVAGAIAGAAGGAIAGTGIITGAISGFAIGAGIAAGFIAGAKIGGTVAIAIGSPGYWVGGIAATATGMAVGSAFVGLSAAATLYGKYAQNQMLGEGMASTAKALSGMPEYEQMREGALLQALLQTVDDPNFTDRGCHWLNQGGTTKKFMINGDPFDSDADGDLSEAIPCFQYWWDRRTHLLAAGLGASAESVIKAYLNSSSGYIAQFRNQFRGVLYKLERSEVECPCQQTGNPTKGGPEGPVLAALRALDPLTSFITFWAPGPGQDALSGWYTSVANDPCITCSPNNPPGGFDSVDSVRMRLEQLQRQLKAIIWSPLVQGVEGYTEEAWIQGLAGSYNDWMPTLIDPNVDPATDGTAYTQMGIILNGDSSVTGMRAWPMLITQAREQLPVCRLAHAPFRPNEYEQLPAIPSTAPNPPTCTNNSPIDHCTWKEKTSALTTGPHFRDDKFADPASSANFPGPTCKVDNNHKTALLNQLQTLTLFTEPTTLKNYILANDMPNPLCPVGEPVVTPPGVEITISEAVLDKVTDKGAKDDLEYTFTYNYSCGSCTTPPPVDCSPQQTAVTNAQADLDAAQSALTVCQTVPPPSCGYCGATCSTSGDCCGTGTCLVSAFGIPVCQLSCTMPPPPPSCTAELAAVATASIDLGNATFALNTCQSQPPPTPVCTSAPKTDTLTKTIPGIGAPSIHVDSSASPAEFQGRLSALRTAVTPLASTFATIDADMVDEIVPTLNAIQSAISAGQEFRVTLQNFYSAMLGGGTFSPLPKATDGRLPNLSQPISGGDNQWLFGPDFNGRYAWEDTHGPHSVLVEIGPFLTPSTGQRKYGTWLTGKTCLVLENYCDGYTPGNSQDRKNCGFPNCCYEPGRSRGRDTWVRITRTDPVGPELSMFWRLNPFGVVTRKTAKARYHTEQVGLDNTAN